MASKKLLAPLSHLTKLLILASIICSTLIILLLVQVLLMIGACLKLTLKKIKRMNRFVALAMQKKLIVASFSIHNAPEDWMVASFFLF